MMIVVTVSCCPPKLRGDLTKWFIEIDTGVFVGNLSARVRDAVWDRVCTNIGSGRATMAFSTNNEQKLDFRIHNTDWEPTDYDGIKLVCRKYPSEKEEETSTKAKQQHINSLSQKKKKPSGALESYVVIDLETTGLQDSAQIIEIGAIRLENNIAVDELSLLVKCTSDIPTTISDLTGITSELLSKEGINCKDALETFREFCGDNELVGHNIHFDLNFLNRACSENGLPLIFNKAIDTMKIARRKLCCEGGYSLTAIADHLGVSYDRVHRALDDCLITYRIYEKLKEI